MSSGLSEKVQTRLYCSKTILNNKTKMAVKHKGPGSVRSSVKDLFYLSPHLNPSITFFLKTDNKHTL